MSGRTRREFLSAAALSALAAPLLARCASPTVAPAVPRIAHFSIASESDKTGLDDLRAGLAEFGYREGENIFIEYRWAGSGDQQVIVPLADELVAIDDLRLFTCTGNATVLALKSRTTKPIIMGSSPDPVENKLIDSLARPGGNVTGVATQGTALLVKRVELIKELMPSIAIIGLLAGSSTFGGGREGARTAAQELGLRLELLDVKQVEDLDALFQRALDLGVQGLVVGSESFNLTNRARIAALAVKHRLPSVHAYLESARDGGLAAIALSRGILRRTGKFVDRILKGAHPSDLPVELWTSGDLFVNLSTANALGMTIPPAVLARATEVFR